MFDNIPIDLIDKFNSLNKVRIIALKGFEYICI